MAFTYVMVAEEKLNGSDGYKLENVISEMFLSLKDFLSNFPQVRFKCYHYIGLEVQDFS